MRPEPVPPEIIDLARHIAVEHALDPALVCAVIEQESAWNPWAVRYEPSFLSRYVAPAGKLSATEAYTRAMSWGLMQVSELCDPGMGVEYGCRILAARMTRAKGDVPAALLAWNGGADQNYAAEVLARKRNSVEGRRCGSAGPAFAVAGPVGGAGRFTESVHGKEARETCPEQLCEGQQFIRKLA